MKVQYLEIILANQNCMYGEIKIKFMESMLHFGSTSSLSLSSYLKI
jgi:hypothetical protein